MRFACVTQLSSISEAKAVIRQVALSLAVAERALNFEHRDLHWGNVLVSATESKTLEYAFDGQTMSVATDGVKVAIIDFTLSRLTKGLLICCFAKTAVTYRRYHEMTKNK